MTRHEDYHFSIAIKTDDIYVVACLRALSKYSQRTGNNQIPWGGTKDADWRDTDNCVTFRFTSHHYRDFFVKQIERLLPMEFIQIVGTSDNDPATKQKLRDRQIKNRIFRQ